LNRTTEKGISDIVGCLTDPIIVFPGGWGDTVHEWLKTAITLERMIGSMKVLKGEEATGTDAEACAYLMTVSLTQHMDIDWTKIYLYVAGKTCRRWNKSEMPDDIAVDSLSDYQIEKLNRLKDWLYRQRIKARTEKDRVQRRQEKENAEMLKKVERPVLFEF
jgi:hypothetical protein